MNARERGDGPFERGDGPFVHTNARMNAGTDLLFTSMHQSQPDHICCVNKRSVPAFIIVSINSE